MKICVLVPSEAYRQNAGARIRYGRLVEALADRGVELELIEIGQFSPAVSDADVLLISKCHDARAQLVAIEACRRGIRVGIDLFDDYFSQHYDPRLVRFRRWLIALAPWLSFALTSTAAMAEVASAYLANAPVLVVNDTAATASGGEILVATGDEIAAKRRRAVDEAQLRVAWFGIGDNPYFAVGLSDVAAYASELASLARLSGMTVKLAILTNARALTSDAMARIADVPFAVEVQEWSEGAEAALLRNSFACFVPVNAQPFSAAKSLNRAITALSSGCQLLSAGYPLYAALNRFIYRDVRELAVDLRDNDLRVSANRRHDLMAILDRWASASREAEALATFLKNLPGPKISAPGRVALIHGASTNDATNALARAMGHVTVGSPYAPSNLEVDAKSQARIPLAIDLLISDPLAKTAEIAPTSIGGTVDYGKKRYMFVTGSDDSSRRGVVVDLTRSGLGVQLALYRPVMAGIRDRLSTDLGIDEIVVSENSPLPLSLV